MIFSVIYSVECTASDDISVFFPPDLDLWQQTEGDDQREYDYLGDVWEDSQHRKWAAILSRDQFTEFTDHLNLTAENIETMGSLGPLGFECGWAPAISFTCEDPDAVLSAYVTPIPQVKREVFNQKDWERIRDSVLAVYA